jgi:hypothetical protein
MSNLKKINFLAYLNNPLTQESIQLYYSSNNIIIEKCELYGDFVQSLLLTVFDTYLGDEVTCSEQQVNHFKWCWDKTILNFKKEGLNLENVGVFTYFLDFLIEVFYKLEDKTESELKGSNIIKLWDIIFDYTKIKTNSDIDAMIEIYNLLDNSLIKNNNLI